MIRCRELVELVTAYLDGVLPAQERERVDLHLAGCDGCTAYLAQIRATIAVLGRAGES
ncbi:putative zinc finger protein [Solirubrobacter pauli]|uniref:Putative zinc finger protein n=1 Tax=Solirubrobacter pauli TaxID=166793 RepID=A0A660KX80_9ACTN|nr:zf-HC2 domain-containing protein [Solirubrobacter pauli]RKQ84911.1 putative zinc finger protein [Solirubrobacter pauli]